MTEPAPPAHQRHLPTHVGIIDAIRALAALAVVVYHLHIQTGSPDFRVLGVNVLRPLHDGWAGVNLFLVLSGFCLFWPVVRSGRDPAYGKFMWRRTRRIVPAYYASLLLVPTAYHFLGTDDYWPRGASDVLLHLTLFHALTPETIRSWNGVTWSLSLEWMWYLAFPVFAIGMLRRPRPTLSVMLAATVAYRVGLYAWAGPASRWTVEAGHALRAFLPGRLAEFGLGMFVAWWVAHRRTPPRAVAAAAVAVPVLLALAHIATPVDTFLPVRDVLYGLGFALLLLVAVEWAAPLRDGGFLRGVGVYSYSLYLFHMPVVSAVCAWLSWLPPLPRFLASLASLPLILIVAKLAFLCFEKPFLRSPVRRPVVEAAVAEHAAP